jgi:hypothetical protein
MDYEFNTRSVLRDILDILDASEVFNDSGDGFIAYRPDLLLFW